VTKNRLEGSEVDLGRVVDSIRRFGQPALDAAREGRAFDRHWPPGGPWRKMDEV